MFCCLLMSSMEQLEYAPVVVAVMVMMESDEVKVGLKSVCPFPLQAAKL